MKIQLIILFTKKQMIKQHKIIVKPQTLDDYINKNNIKNIDILKIDTQSFNKEVIEGAQNF